MTMIHVNWIHLQLLFVISIRVISVCESRNGSCQVIGCGEIYNPSRPCQCNKQCLDKDDCCSDYKQTCGSCQVIGCGKTYRKSRLCQCNKECHTYDNCCSDFKEECGFCQDIGCGAKLNRSRPCQCNKECLKKDDCCSDYSEICESCQSIGCGSRYNRSNPCQCNKKCRSFNNCCNDYDEICGPDILVVILSVAGAIAVMAVIVLLVFYWKVRKERAQRLSKELEDRRYYEIDGANDKTVGVIGQVCQRNDNWEWNTTDSITTTPNDIHGSGNVVRNVAYQSWDLDT